MVKLFTILFSVKIVIINYLSLLFRSLAIEMRKNYENHPHIQKVIKILSNSLIESKDASVPDLRDALLSFLCHKASLPCKSWNALKVSHQRSLQSLNPK